MKLKPQNKILSRREAIQRSTLGVATGITLLDMYANMLPADIRKAISLGSQEALAADPAGRPNPIIQITLIDKTQQPLMLETEGVSTVSAQVLNGLDGMNGATAASYKGNPISGEALAYTDYRGRADMRMTQLFGGRLAGLADGYNLAIIPKVNSNAGGHNLNDSGIDNEKGGLNSALQDTGEDPGNLMGFVGFSLRALANDSSESARGPQGIPLPTFESPLQLRTTLQNSVAPLSASKKALDFRKKLDALAARNSGVLARLLQIKEKIEPAVAGLAVSLGAGLNVVERQVEAVIAVAKTGLCNNFMIAIPWDDTNGGGNLINPGGGNNLSPYVGTAMLADLYVRISQELPNAITVIVSDGGRSMNNGDAAGGMSIISGPAALVNEGVFGTRAIIGNLGNVNGLRTNGHQYQMSAGNPLGILEHKNLIALVLKMAGVEPTVAYPKGISPKAT